MEAGFRSALLLRPDPDPEAGARLRYGLQLTDLFEPAAGAYYAFEPTDIEAYSDSAQRL